MRPFALRSALRAIPRTPRTTPIASPALSTALLVRPFSSTLPILKKNKHGQGAKSPKQKIRVTEDDEAGAADAEGAGEVVIEEVVEKAKGKMEKAVHWAKAVVFEGVERGRGRVTPAILDSVRVTIPDTPGTVHLNSLASVTVKGNTLFVEVWDSASLKQVESAIHGANLPGISPQRMGGTTLKIPVARSVLHIISSPVLTLSADQQSNNAPKFSANCHKRPKPPKRRSVPPVRTASRLSAGERRMGRMQCRSWWMICARSWTSRWCWRRRSLRRRRGQHALMTRDAQINTQVEPFL
ncbi:hypothetical protein L202_01541 [Cryptococcus amylolentus CBS 6039]|uniref:Ribosome recycling factor domain-containing protein n=1 Tax=Cryptococcus amylolentus CBS 6039 TaxID=1295533 RepID=A0A1E3I4F7_9TREE|nr:hypothetical protein L202_01541 [Cryptococcus amylolentus CBS 6039]ODN83397.1 hypothetical protein L202_01541 [Cryptococcus amylolentus CBS 6039]